MTKHLLIVDLEATCWDGDMPGLARRQTVEDMEVIEFGCVVAEPDGKVLDAKSFFVRPVLHPQLSSFCTQLTGISQQQVAVAPVYAEVVQDINAWLAAYQPFCWASWGDYDRHQLDAERRHKGCEPAFMRLEHINLKQLWREGRVAKRRSGLQAALAFHGLAFEGQHHRGIDDARNIARLLLWIPL